MKNLIVLVLILLSVGFGIINAEEKYTTKYDNINIEDVIENERLLKNYVDCLLGRGPCTPDGFELKSKFPFK